MRSYYFLIVIVLVLIFAGFLVFAQEKEMPADVVFPVAELGNCQSRAECMAYCDLSDNMLSCLDFAEKHNLVPKDEIKIARKMLKLGATAGPGGCRGQAACEAYCDDMAHIDECLVFAEKYGLIPADELKEGKKVAAAMKKGIKPPNCRGKSACDVYCSQPANTEECLVFAEAAGLIPPDELGEAKMALKAMKQGIKPPPCRGKQECDAYCGQEEHFAECLTFAEAAGFISPEEATMARKTGGKGPGNCRSKEACDKYCDDPAHTEECLNFAEEHGFISQEDAEKARKMSAAGLTSGPGGCKNEEECRAYCDNPAHGQECFDFAVKQGLIEPEEAQFMREEWESSKMETAPEEEMPLEEFEEEE